MEQTAGSAAPSEPPEDDPAAGSGAPSEPPEDDPAAGSGAPSEPADAGPPAGSGIPAPTGGWNPWIDLIAILSQATLTLESIAELAQDLASLSLDNQLAIVVLNALETSGLCDATDHLACDPVCVVMATQLPSCRFDESCRDALVNVCGP